MMTVSRLDIRFLKEIFIVLLAEITGSVAADLVHDFLSIFLVTEPPSKSSGLKIGA